MDRQINLTLPLTKNSTAIGALLVAIGIGAYWGAALRFQEGPVYEEDGSTQSIAWYVAHIAEAKTVNRICFHSQKTETTHPSEDCQNALKALELAHVSRNYQN